MSQTSNQSDSKTIDQSVDEEMELDDQQNGKTEVPPLNTKPLDANTPKSRLSEMPQQSDPNQKGAQETAPLENNTARYPLQSPHMRGPVTTYTAQYQGGRNRAIRPKCDHRKKQEGRPSQMENRTKPQLHQGPQPMEIDNAVVRRRRSPREDETHATQGNKKNGKGEKKVFAHPTEEGVTVATLRAAWPETSNAHEEEKRRQMLKKRRWRRRRRGKSRKDSGGK